MTSAASGRSTTWLARAALAMAALALVVSLSGVTPASAVNAVKRAFNADAVDGISASRKPRAGRLFPLGTNRKFPRAVLPNGGNRGQRGPAGPQGPAGPSGPATPGVFRVANGPGVTLPAAANERREVARIDNLPAGNWLLMWSATVDSGNAGSTAWCVIAVGATEHAAADATVGNAPGATVSAAMSGFAGVTQTTSFSAVLRCFQSSGVAVNLDSQHLVAIKADSLEVTGG